MESGKDILIDWKTQETLINLRQRWFAKYLGECGLRALDFRGGMRRRGGKHGETPRIHRMT